MSNPDDLDFLSDSEPNVPAVSEPEPRELTPQERVTEAQAHVDSCTTQLEVAKRELNKAIADAHVVEVEIPLHVRNAEAREIDQAMSRDHREALARLTAQGIDVARVVREAPRPRARKPVPPLFTS